MMMTDPTKDLSPEVSEITPTLGPSAGGITITIKGQGFVPGAIVRFAGLRKQRRKK